MRLSEPISGTGAALLRFLASLVLLTLSSAAFAEEPVTAEAALAAQREGLRKVVLPQCDRGEEEIVVCARTDPERDRLPLRSERIAGDRSGGGGTGAAALSATREGCRSRCGFSVDFLRVALVAFKIARHHVDPDSDPPPPPLPSDPYRGGD